MNSIENREFKKILWKSDYICKKSRVPTFILFKSFGRVVKPRHLRLTSGRLVTKYCFKRNSNDTYLFKFLPSKIYNKS